MDNIPYGTFFPDVEQDHAAAVKNIDIAPHLYTRGHFLSLNCL